MIYAQTNGQLCSDGVIKEKILGKRAKSNAVFPPLKFYANFISHYKKII